MESQPVECFPAYVDFSLQDEQLGLWRYGAVGGKEIFLQMFRGLWNLAIDIDAEAVLGVSPLVNMKVAC